MVLSVVNCAQNTGNSEERGQKAETIARKLTFQDTVRLAGEHQEEPNINQLCNLLGQIECTDASPLSLGLILSVAKYDSDNYNLFIGLINCNYTLSLREIMTAAT